MLLKPHLADVQLGKRILDKTLLYETLHLVERIAKVGSPVDAAIGAIVAQDLGNVCHTIGELLDLGLVRTFVDTVRGVEYVGDGIRLRTDLCAEPYQYRDHA